MKKIKNNILFVFYIFLLIYTNVLIINDTFFNYIYRSANFSDLQWSPSVLFLENIDVYKSFFENNLRDLIHESGFPNYSTSSIYIHLIISKMSFENANKFWFILFTFLMIILYKILKKKTELKDIEVFLILSFFIFSKPYMILLSSAQFSLISFFSFFLYFFYKNKKKFIGFFLISVKYSFFPIILFYDIIKHKSIKFTLYTLILSLIFVLHYSFYFESSFFNNLIAPLLIAKETTASGVLDLQTLMGNHPKNDFIRYIILIFIGVSGLLIILNYTKRNTIFDLSICSLLTLLIFKHLYYDFVFLLPVLIYATLHTKKIAKYIIFLIVFYFWFIYLNNFTLSFLYSKIFMLVNFIFINILLGIVVITNLKKI
tara:strand:- start:991 stop:2106 length:1116 start_codon:yes stop_codon:yes gene_type:complete